MRVQQLVTLVPWTFIAQILNLFIQVYLIKRFLFKPVQKILKESVLSVELAQNLLVIKTLSGLASGACSAIDSIHIEGLVGSLAGDDTIFLAMRNEDVARSVLSELRDLL